MQTRFITTPLLLLALTSSLRAEPGTWTAFGRDATHTSVTSEFAGPLSSPDWIASLDPDGNPIEFVGQSGVIVWSDLLFALGESDDIDRLYAFDRTDGSPVYAVPIDRPSLDSWSTPLVDAANQAVIVASGNSVQSFDARSGSPKWVATLALDIVNASPIVTTDLGPRDRVFVTDSDGFLIQGGGHLYCINADPFDASTNPYEPGDIVWQLPLGAASSGNTPAYENGVVLIADSGDPGFGLPGRVRAYDATGDTMPSEPIWEFTNTSSNGFYGGVSIRDGFAYAASFAFSGGQESGNLVKLDASTGSLVWSSPCVRTSSTPIALADGRVLLSGGLAGFGALPTLQLFAPGGTRLWDTALDTFDDANNNGFIELGEFFSIGSWTHLPVVVESPTGTFAYAGTQPTSGGLFGPNTDCHLIDLDLLPADAGFAVESFAGAGSTPALTDGVLATIGEGGVHTFGAFAGFAPADVNRDDAVNTEDLFAWESGTGTRDVDGDGSVTSADRDALRAILRGSETADITGGSR